MYEFNNILILPYPPPLVKTNKAGKYQLYFMYFI